MIQVYTRQTVRAGILHDQEPPASPHVTHVKPRSGTMATKSRVASFSVTIGRSTLRVGKRRCRHEMRPDRLLLGGECVRIGLRSLVAAHRDAGRCAVVTVDKELFADTLPTYLTRFVGRDQEIASVLSMLHPGRLVTICGVGGAGKTRLAIEVARRSRARSGSSGDGEEVYWVPLGAVVDPAQVPAAIATGIGVTGAVGDKALAPVVRALADRQSLLVLDNCEQVAAACGELLALLLAACPAVTVLATSRVPLEMPAEEVFAIPPMGGGMFPSDPFDSDATALFLDRTTLVAGGYAVTEHNARTLGEICAVLHGLPLAIELAASWIPVLSPRDLLDHLRQADITLASDTPFVEERHRSLGVILDSSWGWLSARERTTLSALAIFVGGFTREAAEAVADADLGVLATLTERSMIQRLPDAQGGSRYQVHELVRTYALRQVADDGPVRARHFRTSLSLWRVSKRLGTPKSSRCGPILSGPIWLISAPPRCGPWTRATPSEPYGWWSVSTGSGSSLSPRPQSAWRGWRPRWACRGRRRVSTAPEPEDARTIRPPCSTAELTQLPPRAWRSRDSCFSRRSATRQA